MLLLQTRRRRCAKSWPRQRSNWVDVADGDDNPPEYVDYFNDGFLQRLYSKDFVAKYREAAKYPAYEDGGSPFDYDVIAMGQDGCSINDLKIEAAPDRPLA